MKPDRPHRRNHAMTLVEVVFVIFILVVLVVILLPALATSRRKPSRIGCVNNLKQIGLAYRIWADDNGGKYPMELSFTNGGTMDVAFQDGWLSYLVMSNELSTPKILICRDDKTHVYATNFATLTPANISYFIGLDASTNRPQTFLAGDDDFLLAGTPVKSGLFEFPPNAPVAWSSTRHKNAGNVGMADGSVQMLTTPALQQALAQTGLATNRLVIP